MFLELQLEMRFIESTTMAKTLAGNFDICNSHFTGLLVARLGYRWELSTKFIIT